MKYNVNCELFGKKFNVNIDAKSEADAEYKIRGAVKINNISPAKKQEAFDIITYMFNDLI